MSRYDSLCTAINVMEGVARMMNTHGYNEGHAAEVIADLRDIAKDVRYGGKWDGDFEVIARALTCCVEPGRSCQICPYRKAHTHECIIQLKKDAIACIRQMSKILTETEKKLKLAEDILKQQDQEVKREVAPWQAEVMDGVPPEPMDDYPWDDDETTKMAPAEDGGVF